MNRKVRLLKSNQIYELTLILTVMSQRWTVQLRSRRGNTVQKLNPSHVTTRAFTLAQWLYRRSNVQVAYSPSSPIASKSDDEGSKFYTPFYNDRIKQDLHMPSQSLKPKCMEKKVKTDTSRTLLYMFRQSILFPIKRHLFHNFIFLVRIIPSMLCASNC